MLVFPWRDCFYSTMNALRHLSVCIVLFVVSGCISTGGETYTSDTLGSLLIDETNTNAVLERLGPPDRKFGNGNTWVYQDFYNFYPIVDLFVIDPSYTQPAFLVIRWKPDGILGEYRMTKLVDACADDICVGRGDGDTYRRGIYMLYAPEES